MLFLEFCGGEEQEIRQKIDQIFTNTPQESLSFWVDQPQKSQLVFTIWQGFDEENLLQQKDFW